MKRIALSTVSLALLPCGSERFNSAGRVTPPQSFDLAGRAAVDNPGGASTQFDIYIGFHDTTAPHRPAKEYGRYRPFRTG
jgi:hypothetical protein